MTPITSWRPFRSFVRRDGLFDDLCREFVRLPEFGADPAAPDTEHAASDDEATSSTRWRAKGARRNGPGATNEAGAPWCDPIP